MNLTKLVIFMNSMFPVLCSSGHCNSSPLGLQSGDILDSQLSSSSSYALTVDSSKARLGREEGGGAWCPRKLVDKNLTEWLEVDLGRRMTITKIALQGRWANGVGKEFAPYVVVSYFDAVTGRFVNHVDQRGGGRVKAANKDTYSVEEVLLQPVIVTNKIRVLPYSEVKRSVCLRLELYGCEGTTHEEKEQKAVKEVVLELEDVGDDWLIIVVIVLITFLVIILGLVIALMIVRIKNRLAKFYLSEEQYSDHELYYNDHLIYEHDSVRKPKNDQYLASHKSQEDPIYAVPFVSSPQSSTTSSLSSLSEDTSAGLMRTTLLPTSHTQLSTQNDFVTFSPLYSPF